MTYPLKSANSQGLATGVEARFQSMTTEQFKQHLEASLHFPNNVALSMAENLSCYRTNPNMITDHTDYAAKDVSWVLTRTCVYFLSRADM